MAGRESALRVGIDLRLFSYRPAGIANYAVRLARELVAMGDPIVAYQHRKTPDRLTDARTRWLWTPCHHRIESAALAVELFAAPIDVFHSPDFIPPHGPWFRKVITVHDLTFRFFPEFLTKESRRYYGQLDRALAEADAVIADSFATRRDLAGEYGYPEERVTVVHLAADDGFLPLSRPAVASFLAEHGLPDRYILWVGTLEPRKNVDGLLRAYRLLDDPPPLVLAGQPGWLHDETVRLVETLGLTERVTFHRPASAAEFPFLYNGAALLVMPSFYEGFGFPVLEAMACGVPVVCSNRGSLPEVAGDAAIQVEPDDMSIAAAISTVLDDPEAVPGMIARGRAHARTFSWRRAAEETRTVYQRAAA